jgi:hypothetical protein
MPAFDAARVLEFHDEPSGVGLTVTVRAAIRLFVGPKVGVVATHLYRFPESSRTGVNV